MIFLRIIAALVAVGCSVSIDPSRGLAQEDGFSAAIHEGTCADAGDIVAPLTNLVVPTGARLGSDEALPAANSFTTVPMALDAISAADHLIVINGPVGDGAASAAEGSVAPAVVTTTEGTITGETIIDISDRARVDNSEASEDNESAANTTGEAATALEGVSEGDHVLACGEIAGAMNENGAAIIGLAPRGTSDISGIAFLSPNPDPSQANISLFISGERLADTTGRVDEVADDQVPQPPAHERVSLNAVDSRVTDPCAYEVDGPTEIPIDLNENGGAISTEDINSGGDAAAAIHVSEACLASLEGADVSQDPNVGAANAPTPIPTPTPTPAELTLDYLQPGQRSGPYAGFAVRFTNNTDADILNPQTEVIVELGGYDWTCQGYGDPISGAPVTGVMDVLGMPLVIPSGEEVPVVIYCRIPEVPLDTTRPRLR